MSELRKYVQFECTAQTYGTDRNAAKLAKSIKEDCGLDEVDAITADIFTMIYVCTRSAVFSLDGSERQPVRDFKTRWEALGKKPTPKALWDLRISTPHPIVTEWITQFNSEQSMFDVPVEQKPPGWLSDEERQEAKNLNSFLAEPTANGKSA